MKHIQYDIYVQLRFPGTWSFSIWKSIKPDGPAPKRIDWSDGWKDEEAALYHAGQALLAIQARDKIAHTDIEEAPQIRWLT